MAKSAVKSIFSSLSHPSFFALKSPFFALFPVLSPTSGDFSRDRARFGADCRRFFEGSLLSFPSALLFLHCVKVFPIRLFPFFILCSTFLFPLISFPPLFPPYLHLPPPLSFSFLPTFPSSFPINERSHAPSRTTRVRVRLHIRTRQEVFVYCLHRFTHLPQSDVHQYIRCEGKTRKSLHKIHIHLIINELTIKPRFHPP